MRPPPTSVRPARERDLERLVDIHTSAFPDARGHDARIANFTRNRFGHLQDLHVVVEGDAIVAHAFLFALQAYVGGVPVPVGGLATLGIAPEARGRGIASRLIAHLHAAAQSRGDAAMLLYPFRQGFYGRHGYAPASSYRRLRFHPASVPWPCAHAARPASSADLPGLAACREAAAIRGTGMLVRTEKAWEAHLYDERKTWLVVEGDDGVEGYVAWRLEQREAHAETTLVVVEMAAHTPGAERSLWGLVGAQRDQVATVHIDVAQDDPIDRALVDPDRACFGDSAVEHPIGQLVAGPMIRALDPVQALVSRGWTADGALCLGIDEAAYVLTARDGVATVASARLDPDVRMNARTFASVVLGGLRPTHAAQLGWLVARDPAALALADELLALPPYFSTDPF